MSAFLPEFAYYFLRRMDLQLHQKCQVQKSSSHSSTFVLQSLDVQEREIDILDQPPPILIAILVIMLVPRIGLEPDLEIQSLFISPNIPLLA